RENDCGKPASPRDAHAGHAPRVRVGIGPTKGDRVSEKRRPLLIVEDDPALQKQMRWAFDQYEPVLAQDRESAIAQLRRCEPAVVTMDLGLPPDPDGVTEGFRLLQEMLTLSPDVKVIMLTGQH